MGRKRSSTPDDDDDSSQDLLQEEEETRRPRKSVKLANDSNEDRGRVKKSTKT